MTNDIESKLIDALSKLYKKGGVYKALFDWMGTFQRDRAATSIDVLSSALKITPRDARELARELTDLECGEFIVGRRGAKSRVAWNYSLRGMAAVAKGASNTLPASNEDSDDEPVPVEPMDADLIDHPFKLRMDRVINLRLPKDLTAREAERLATFIQAIPFAE